MPILPDPPGGAAYVYTVVADVINATWDLAGAKQTEFSTKIANATSGFLDITAPPTVTAGTAPVPTIDEPAVLIPSSIDTAT